MNDIIPLLQELVGKEVEVHSIGGDARYVDRCVLEGFDTTWIRLRKGYDVLYFPVYRIRLLKVV
jgi:hypothetical protein